MTSKEANQLYQTYKNQYVHVTTTDGKRYNGYLIKADGKNLTLSVQNDAKAQSKEERWVPFFPLVIPLSFIAGVAAGRYHHYPYPYYSPYPYSSYPVYPYYPYY